MKGRTEALSKLMRWVLAFVASTLLIAGSEDNLMIVCQSGTGGWTLTWKGKVYPCAIGKNGVAEEGEKREGDGCTPSGTFLLRKVYYRADRVSSLHTALPSTALSRKDGWCDDPQDPSYNRWIQLPYRGHHEELWREKDALYDVVVVIGYNDEPVIPGFGSAIFLHVAGRGYSSTAGCVALSRGDLLEILKAAGPHSRIRIVPPRK